MRSRADASNREQAAIDRTATRNLPPPPSPLLDQAMRATIGNGVSGCHRSSGGATADPL
jgi:hypothetical protein